MKNLSLLTLVMVISASAFAAPKKKAATAPAEGQTTIQLDEAAEKKNKVDGNIDEEITNKKLRTESGSKSKYSLSTNLIYNGGSVNEPFAAERPNLYASSGIETKTAMALGASIRYRANKNDSFTLGVTAGAITPLQGDVNKGQQFQLYDPSLGYSRAFQAMGLQNIFGAGVSYGTSKVSVANDKVGDIGVGHTVMKTFKNGVSLGGAVQFDYNFYSTGAGDNKNNRISGYGGDSRTDWSLGLYPMFEYEFTDKLSFRTVFRYTSWFHNLGDDNDSILKEVGTQSMGLGWSVTRDIYLYPNIQFLWQDIDSERTNVAVNMTANIF